MHLLYSFSLKKLVLISSVFLLFSILFTGRAHAASLSSASATLTTSRPSASSPISTSVANVGDGQITIYNNGSRFLASDSAKIIRNQGGVITNSNLIVASQSAGLTTVFLGNTVSTLGAIGADVLFVPITAMHTVSFTTITSIPSGGHIIITYPGAANNTASPSASTFAFNNLTSSQISYKLNSGGTVTCTSLSVSAPVIDCTTTGGTINNGEKITFLIGCADASTNESSCATQAPRLINPTKSAAAGTADIWKVGIQTTNSSSVVLDTSTVAMGTVDSVTVRATIDPSLTFSIAGVTSGSVASTNGGCSQLDTVNTGIAATTTEVPLGVLSLAPAVDTTVSNIGAQLLTVTTNGANGYSITATSSGHLLSPSTGFFLTDSLTPTVFPASGHFFGLHACGIDADMLSTKWTSTTSDTACNTRVSGSAGNLCKYGWPTSTNPIVIAQDTSGPVGNSILTGNGLTSISYAATQDVTLPPGQYQTVITYVATPSF